MFNRKNKYRKHTCKFCGYSELNIYYGYKSYDDLPIIRDFRELHRDKCGWCGKYYYYLTREE
jgi:hypothetical protein